MNSCLHLLLELVNHAALIGQAGGARDAHFCFSVQCLSLGDITDASTACFAAEADPQGILDEKASFVFTRCRFDTQTSEKAIQCIEIKS